MNIDKKLVGHWANLITESEEINYDDFIPDDVSRDELESKLSILDYLAKEFKKNPDKCLKMFMKYKEHLGDFFEMMHNTMK